MDVNPRKVLVIKDEAKIVEFIESYLINSGYEVYKAFSGRQALKIFADNSIDLILLDLMLPDLSYEHNNGLCQSMIANMITNMSSYSGNWKGQLEEKRYPIISGEKEEYLQMRIR